MPDVLGRTAYRVVQEGLTNARKHAPGAPVEVTVTADGPGRGGRGHQPPPGAASRPDTAGCWRRRRADRADRAGGARRRRAGLRSERGRGLRAPRDHPEPVVTGPIRVLLVDDDALVRRG